MDDRLSVALYLLVLVFGGFAVLTLQVLPGVRFHWRWLAWTAIISFGAIGTLFWFGRAQIDPGFIAVALMFSLGAGAYAAAGGLSQIMYAIARRRAEERQNKDKSG